MADLEERISSLSPEQRLQVEAFIESLIASKSTNSTEGPRFEWAGALADLKDRYTSVELQHEISSWRTGGQ